MIRGLANGCFDVIHRGHIELFQFSKYYCDWLIVAINSDDSIKKLKGENRPYYNQEDRRYVLESIKWVDEVVIFNELTPYNIIVEKKPNILIKGSDYKNKRVIGSDLVENVLYFPYKEGYSTSIILGKYSAGSPVKSWYNEYVKEFEANE